MSAELGCAVVLFTRDLRIHDHHALHTALGRARHVVPLFVLDPALAGAGPNRVRFLLDALADLRGALRRRGGDLVIRRGDVITETLRVAREHGARAIVTSADVSGLAQHRERRLAKACDRARIELVRCPGVTVVPPHQLRPRGGDHYRVFTPYWRAWRAVPSAPPLPAPARVPVPTELVAGRLPPLEELAAGCTSPALPPGGETAGRRRLDAWADELAAGAEQQDDLAADATSRLSPYLHFGCVSPRDAAAAATGTGSEAFLRQLCWRDFHHQVTAAFPAITTEEYRPRGDRWEHGGEELAAWREGRTGYPIVDAGMRQLLHEGWMHNRARLITASFLCKDLYVDWRLGARHFMTWLVDGDVADNYGNWQWVAGTGNDTRPHRVLNPLRQAARFDPHGDYVRRYVPELASVPGAAVHRPWELDPEVRMAIDYPDPIVEHDDAIARFRAARQH